MDGTVGPKRKKVVKEDFGFWPEQLEERSLPFAGMRQTAGESRFCETFRSLFRI